MTFRITHEAPKSWVVELCTRRGGWFWNAQWRRMGVFKTEEDAIECIKKNADFEPHTSYYDKHGNMHVMGTDW